MNNKILFCPKMKKKVWECDAFLAENRRQTEHLIDMISRYGKHSKEAKDAAQFSYHFLRENTFKDQNGSDPDVKD